jgi:cyclopropane-fatty-acyl-phospholipid synthase
LWYGDEDLHTAQINKINWHLEHVRARGASRLLDVGCGWGALLRHSVEDRNVTEAVGLSLSGTQVRHVESLSLPGVQVRLESWTDHMCEPNHYDAIVSIGAFEHFARLDQSIDAKLAGYRAFFSFCYHALRAGGRLTLQTITYESSNRTDFSKFFAEEIFPESDLPRLEEIVIAIRGTFEIEMLRNDRAHYARTARAWLSNLRARRAEAIALVGSDRVRKYERYLGLLVVGFHTGTMNLARIAMRRREGGPRHRTTGGE